MGDFTTEQPLSSSSPSCASDSEEAPPRPWRSLEAAASGRVSMHESPRNIAWERRRRQYRRKSEESLTDEDLHELKGCIELGFGFNAEEGQRLCTTIPALDLYFAVNRQFLTSPLASPTGKPPGPAAAAESPQAALSPCASDEESDSWKILNPGDDPQQVKTKLRHWAQAVACSVLQSPIRSAGMD